MPSLDVDQFEAAAAQIADKAVGIGDARHDAHGGEARLLLAGQHIDMGAERLFRHVDELRAVLRLARGGGRHRIDLAGADLARQARGSGARRQERAPCPAD